MHSTYLRRQQVLPAAVPPLSHRRRPSCSWLNRHLVYQVVVPRIVRYESRFESAFPVVPYVKATYA
jgi:hypothetical protein